MQNHSPEYTPICAVEDVTKLNMKILFLHGWHSVPGGVKPTHLKDRGHEVINPPHDDNDLATGIVGQGAQKTLIHLLLKRNAAAIVEKFECWN